MSGNGSCSSSSLRPADVAFAYDQLYESRKLWAQQRFMGVQCQQNPMDAWILQEILFDARPQLLIETGTQNGGGALYYAAMMHLYDPSTRVLTVDTRPVAESKPLYAIPGFCARVDCRNATDSPLWAQHVEHVRGDSLSPPVLERVRRAADEGAQRHGGARQLARVAAREHVRRELDAYHTLVTPGQYLVVQDTKLDRLRGRPSAKAAVRAFMSGAPGAKRFVTDRSREYLLYSQHAEGYLRRL